MGMRTIVAVTLMVFTGLCVAQDEELKTMEEYVMGDAEKAIASLMPETERSFFFKCLHYQKAGDLEKADDLLFKWAQVGGFKDYVPISPKYAGRRLDPELAQSGYSAEIFDRMALRQAFLYYKKDPTLSLGYLADTVLSLDFKDREADFKRAGVVHPTALDQKMIVEDAFSKVVEQSYDVDVSDLYGDLPKEEKALLYRHVTWPDVPKMMAWVLADLGSEDRKFGDLEVHKALTLDQLKACLKRYPKLVENDTFVKQYVTRIMPRRMEGKSGKARYLKDLLGFTRTLPRSMAALHLTAVYNALLENLRKERFDAALFEEYLSIAMPPVEEERGPLPELPKSFPPMAELALTAISEPAQSDLINRHLAAVVKTDQGVERMAPYFTKPHLAKTVAESRLLYGIGDAAAHLKTLGAAQAKALRDRGELTLPPINPKRFGANADVALQVDLKNVESLLINVYALNLKNYLVDNLRYPSVGLNVDGIQPTHSRRKAVDADPLRRVRQTVGLPELKKPGAYLIELVGGDKSCRIMIVKGRLFLKSTVTAAGYKLEIFDEAGVRRKNATVQLGTRVFETDKHGDVMVPFAQKYDARRVVVSSGGVHSLASFQHDTESYRLSAQFFAARESLMAGRPARIILRPRLTVTGAPLPLAMLRDPVVTVDFLYRDDQWKQAGALRDLEMKDGRELVVEVPVPEHAVGLRLKLSGMIEHIDQSTERLQAGSGALHFNVIKKTQRIKQGLVKETPKGYQLHVLGRNGEPWAGVKVAASFWRNRFKKPVKTWLQTDADGIVNFGALTGIHRVEYAYAGYTETLYLGDKRLERYSRPVAWEAIRTRQLEYPEQIMAKKGDAIVLPFDGTLTPGSAGLIQMVGKAYLRNCYDAMRLDGGALRIEGLDAGTYDLWLKRLNKWIQITVVDGKPVGDFLLVGDDVYEPYNPKLMRVTRMETSKKDLVIRLTDAGKTARIHVIASRFLPVTNAMDSLDDGYHGGSPNAYSKAPRRAQFSQSLVLDPEYLYVLNRQTMRHFPGNMLQRPGILLNPFDQDTIENIHSPFTFIGPLGGRYGGRRKAVGKYGGSGMGGRDMSAGTHNPFTMDWMETPARVITNLIPDSKGIVKIPVVRFGDCHYLTILALDDNTTSTQWHVLEPKPIAKRDLRLKKMIPPGTRKRWQSQVFTVKKGAELKVKEGPANQTRVMDSQSSLYAYGLRAGDNAWRLRDFSFLLNWPSMTQEQKLEKYSEFVSHELNFFVYKKDRPFFDTVVKPYLANKRDKTFMDHWLLGMDLTEYTNPVRFSQELNVMEKVLLAERVPAVRDMVGNYLRWELRHLDDQTIVLDDEFDTGFDAMGQMGQINGQQTAPVDVNDEPEVELEEIEEPFEAEALEEPVKSVEAARSKMRNQGFYKMSAPISIFIETNYYKRALDELNADFVPPSKFWQDYMERDKKAPFLPVSILSAAHNSAEWIFAMALTDLPFKGGTKVSKKDGSVIRKFTSDAIVFRRSFKDVPLAKEASTLFMTQNYYDVSKYGKRSGNAEAPYYVTTFEPGRVYGCQLVVSNPSKTPVSIEVMAQIPIGSIPITRDRFSNPKTTIVKWVDLGSFRNAELHYTFYFPAVGSFASYPGQALSKDKIVATCKQVPIAVAIPKKVIETDEWGDLAEGGAVKDIIAYLEEHGIDGVDLSRLSSQLKDKAFYEAMIQWCRDQALTLNVVYDYAFYHKDVETVKLHLQSRYSYGIGGSSPLGYEFVSPLLAIRRHRDRTFEHMELDPAINPRAHAVAGQRVLAGHEVKTIYAEALRSMCYKKELNDADRLELAYHLFLQDRIGEALALFDKVDRSKLTTKLQYDYFKAYALFYKSDVAGAEAIAKPYANHPVALWRTRFNTVLEHAAQTRIVAGQEETTNKGDAESNKKDGAQKGYREPVLSAKVMDETIELTHANLNQCTMGVYVMNLEFLFSKNPFIETDHGHFLHIVPNHSQAIALDKAGKTKVTIPKKYKNENLLIEFSGGGKRVVQTRVASGLVMYLEQNRGQLKVVDGSGKPVAAAYVKVYASEVGGKVVFYKDGYTDLRGRFDYAALNSSPNGSNPLARVKKFAILVATKDKGSLVKEVAPPSGSSPSRPTTSRRDDDPVW